MGQGKPYSNYSHCCLKNHHSSSLLGNLWGCGLNHEKPKVCTGVSTNIWPYSVFKMYISIRRVCLHTQVIIKEEERQRNNTVKKYSGGQTGRKY